MKIAKHIGLAVALLSALLFTGGTAEAGNGSPGPQNGPSMMMHGHRPYGGYCRGPRWGWYGARTPVDSKQDARRHLVNFFAGQDVLIGKITQRGKHYFADILDKDHKIVDRVIIDKRTGRIRSLY